MNNLVQDPFLHKFADDIQSHDGVLAGLRLAVKDLFHIQGAPTTAGNPTWAKTHSPPEATASAVSKLLDAGATLVGKTITDELAYSLNGVNTHYGMPINVNAPNRIVGGSSSGSAAAVAMDLADIGLGTDTGGSIRVPSSYNGLFGLRPSHGSVSMDNMVGLAPSFDTIGWMTRDLNTLRKVASVCLAPSSRTIENIRFGQFSSVINEVEHGQALLRALPHIDTSDISQSIDADLLETASQAFRILQGREIWAEHGEWIEQVKPTFAEDIQLRLDWCKTLTEQQHADAKTRQRSVQQQMNALLEQWDVLILPTTPGPAPLLDMPANELAEYRNKLLGMTALAGLCGLPQLHIPIANALDAPCGISLIGAKHQDLFLLDIANDYFKDINHD